MSKPQSVMAVMLLTAALACAPSVQHIKYRGDVPAKLGHCELDVYERGQRIERAHERIGEVWIHDSGFSVRCGKEVVRSLTRDRACDTGADAIEVHKESFPDWFSTCYRIKVYFLRYTDEDAGEQGSAVKSPGRGFP